MTPEEVRALSDEARRRLINEVAGCPESHANNIAARNREPFNECPSCLRSIARFRSSIEAEWAEREWRLVKALTAIMGAEMTPHGLFVRVADDGIDPREVARAALGQEGTTND